MYRGVNTWTRPSSGLRNIRLPVLITFIIIFVLLFLRDSTEKSSSPSVLIKKKWNSVDSMVQFDPTVEFRNGTDVIWQIPDLPKAVLFLAHGCNGRAANFWDRSSKCPNCIGLPEERMIVLQALARKFAVLTVSSAGRCWSLGKERLAIKGIIKWWVEKQELEMLPLVALGASSGGHFVSLLATNMRFSSIAIMIAEGVFDQMDIPKDYPPTIFVHMPKDEARKQKLGENLEILKEQGIDVAEVKCMEFPLSPKLLADRIPGLDLSISVKLFNLFQEKGFIDKNGYMKNDGRAVHWKAALEERKFRLPHKLLANYIQEELNLAFAYHEMTSLPSEHIFNWFESHMS